MTAPSTTFAAGETASRGKTRLAVVGATYASVEPRKKIEQLAKYFDLTCITCRTYTGYGLVNRVEDQPAPTTYRLIALPSIGEPDSTTKYALRGLGKALRDAQPEIVLVETEPWAWLRWQTWWCARRLRLRVRFGEFSWENLRRTGLKGWVLAWLYRLAARTADFVIGGNEEAGQFFVEVGLAPERLLVSPQLGVDVEEFRPTDPDVRVRRRAELGLPPDALIVGYSGRQLEMKGVPDLIDAVEQARQRPGGEAIHLALLGPGELAPLLRNRKEKPPWIHTFPACPHAQMANFLQAIDLFVLASREWDHNGLQWREQFGHVLIEAMACGVPAVGSSCGAIPSVLNDPAHIFPQGDVLRLTEMIRTLIFDPELRAATVRQQTERLHAHYTNPVLAKEWAEFIQRFALGCPASEGN